MIQPNKNKTIKNKLLLFLFSFLICFSFLFAPTQKARAAAWPAIDPLIKSALDVIQGTLKGMIVGAAKKAALMAMEQEINFAITGNSSGGAMFITNWNKALYADPEAKAKATMTKFIASMTSGRGSLSGYISNTSASIKGTFGDNYEGVGSGSMAYGLGGVDAVRATTGDGSAPAGLNYTQYIQKIAANSIKNTDCQLTYGGRLPNENIFKDLNRNIDNSGWKMQNCIAQKFAEEKAKEEDMAKTQSVAYQGFKGAETDGRITNPGSLIKDAKAGVQNIGGQIIAAAQDIPSVLTAIATQMITQSITQGIGDMQARVHQEISDVRSKSSDAMNSAIGTSGPGALYR